MAQKAFDKAGFDAVAERIGGLDYTKKEKKEIIKAINAAIEKKKSELKSDKFSKKVMASLEKEMKEFADILGGAAAAKATEILEGRIPIDLTADLTTITDFGKLSGDIDEHSKQVFEDVVLFHTHAAAEEGDKANDKLKDILNTEESTELEAIYNTLRENFGNRKEVKSLRKQLNAVVRVNKVFAKQYSKLDGRRTLDVWWELRDLANAYNEAQKKATDALQKHRSGLSEIDVDITPDLISDGVLNFYQSKIDEWSANLTPDVVKSVYLSPTFGMTEAQLKNVNFEELADELAREAYHQIEFGGSDDEFEKKKKALDAFKSIARGRARKKSILLKAKSPLEVVAGVFRSSAPETDDSDEIMALRKKRAEIKDKVEAIKSKMPPRGPHNNEEVNKMEAEIKGLKAEYSQIGKDILKKLDAEAL